MNVNSGDTFVPRENSDAQVAQAVHSTEIFPGVRGLYSARCVGPVAHKRARYCELRELLEGLTDKEIADDPVFAGWHAELVGIPLEERWSDTIENLVVNAGKNLALDTILAGSAYTVVGPYMGLTQATPSPAATDTMGSHGGWIEAGGSNAPTYTAPRKTVSFSSASGGLKASIGTYTYAITSTGTVGGAFIVFGPGAVATLDSAAGVLLSAGAFTGGNKSVNSGDSLTVTWQLSL